MEKIVLMSGEPVKYLRVDGGYTLRYFLTDSKADEAFNVVLQSSEEYDKRKLPVHELARKLAGKAVRVTIETLD